MSNQAKRVCILGGKQRIGAAEVPNWGRMRLMRTDGWTLVLALGLSSVTFGCGLDVDEEELVASTTEPIANGSAFASNTSTVQLQIKLGGNDGSPDSQIVGDCTGQIISRDMILTAGHCFRINTPNENYRWWNKAIPVSVTMKSSTGGNWTSLTGSGYRSASVRIHPSYSGYKPWGGPWYSHAPAADIATVQFTTAIAQSSQVGWLDAGGSTSYNGYMVGYGKDRAGATDLRAGWVAGNKSGGVHYFNWTSSQPQACDGDSGGPLIANGTLFPSHQFAVISMGNCSNDNLAAAVSDSLWFITAPISNRCTTKTVIGSTPPPQPQKALTRCY